MISFLVYITQTGLSLLDLIKLLFNNDIEEIPSPFRFEIPYIEGKAIFDENDSIKFEPTVGYQRYLIVKKILEEKNNHGGIAKVVDLGCSNIRFFTFVKNMEGVREYLGVDIDENMLTEFIHRVSPLNYDYLSNRIYPFKAKVMSGSASEPDVSLENANAIVAIELIEHMYPEELNDLPYTIFGIVQPEIAIFTTPNSDFNIYFPDMIGFRHLDHKFEWTQEQFQDWAKNLTKRYPYEVEFRGVGPGPKGPNDKLGCCSQLALFFRKSLFIEKSNEFKESYRVLCDIDYPIKKEEDINEEIIVTEVQNLLWRIENDGDSDKVKIPFSLLVEKIKAKIDCKVEFLRSILSKYNYEVCTVDGNEVVIISMGRTSSDSSDEEINCIVNFNENWDTQENWDLENEMDSSKPTNRPSPSNVFIPIEKPENSESILRCKSYDQILDKNKCKNFRFSLNMENLDCDKIVNSGSISMGSKAADSGYPNSINMDMDLTPEQVDEITTESESSFDESGEEPIRHDVIAGVAHLLDNVENGDVANNNRDGEGNNMEDNRPGEALEFQQLIHEDVAQANLAVNDDHDSEEESIFSIKDIIQIECISTTATIGSDPVASNLSLFGIQSHILPSQEITENQFPDWLLNLDLIEEPNFIGTGDAVDHDLDLLDDSQPSLEMIVPGDTLGGGDPSY